MSWCSLKFETTANDAMSLSDLLDEVGALSVTMESAGDRPLFEEPDENAGLWSEVRLTALFDHDTNINPVLKKLRDSLGRDLPPYTSSLLHDQDWSMAWRDQFKPIQFGSGLWICPSWEDPPEPDAINLYIDPGMAFGTGNHQTTLMCLQWLGENRTLLKHASVLDYGCGSGILAIAAARLGANPVFGIDIDADALIVARENAVGNECKSVQFGLTDMESPRVNFLLANILAGPLIELQPKFAELLIPGGNLVLSGLLAEQVDDIVLAYQPDFELQPPRLDGEWAMLYGVKK